MSGARTIGFGNEFLADSIFDTTKFKLDKDEVARISPLDLGLSVHLVHWVTVSKDKHRDNGNHFCFGDYDKITGTDKVTGVGSDPEACIYCKNAVRNGAIAPAARRFGLNIIRYLTDNKGNLRDPLQIDVIAWIFGEDKYKRLVAIKNQYGPLQGLDLQVKCTAKQYQNFDIDPWPANQCLWLNSGDPFKLAVVEKFKAERQPSLVDLLGNTESQEKAVQIVREAMGVGPQTNGGNGAVPLQPASLADLNKLLEDAPKPTAPVVPTASPVTPPPAPANQPITAPPTAVAPVQAQPPATAPAPTQSFMDLLK